MPFSRKLARFARRTLLVCAVAGTLVIGLVVVENWRGERVWRAYAKKQAVLGDPVDVFPSPSSLPRERNFMKTPVLDRLLFAAQAERSAFVAGTAQPALHPEWRRGQALDLAAYGAKQRAERKRLNLPELPVTATPAAVVLAAQAPLEPLLTELRRAVRERPASQIVRPQAIARGGFLNAPMANFDVARALMAGLSVRACASLAEGDGNEACEDTLAALRLVRGFTEMPDVGLVEAMFGTILLRSALQPVWEGLPRGEWNADQLARLQQEMAAIRPLEALARGLRQERVGFACLLSQESAGRILELSLIGGPREEHSRLSYLRLPRGWLLQNAAVGCAVMQEPLDVLKLRGTPEFLPAFNAHLRARAAFAEGRTTVYNCFAKMAVASPKVVTGVIASEVEVSLARTACALERHRVAHGGYPESLDELVPAYCEAVPRDVIDGQPLRYRRLEDGSFTLYSVGLNGTDDGGVPSDWQTDAGRRHGDWCWPRPAR